MALKDTLSKKVGPLPLGVWLLAVGGGLGLSYYIQRGPSDEDVELEEEGTDFDEFNPQPFSSGAVGLPDFGTQSPIAPPTQNIVSNDQWLALGVNYSISIGVAPLKAQDALTKYLEGKPLSEQEQSIVSNVIRHLGGPPEGAPSVDPGDETPEPEDPPPTEDPSLFAQWGTDIPVAVKEAYSNITVAVVLLSLGHNPLNFINIIDVQAGLKKLGWSKSEDLAVNVTNVGRLVSLKRAPKEDEKPSSQPKPSKPEKDYVWHTVKKGENLSTIAKKYGTTWQKIWNYNITPGNRPKSTIKTLKKRGPSLTYTGSRWKIPKG